MWGERGKGKGKHAMTTIKVPQKNNNPSQLKGQVFTEGQSRQVEGGHRVGKRGEEEDKEGRKEKGKKEESPENCKFIFECEEGGDHSTKFQAKRRERRVQGV